jgi:hypothetical protein
MAGAAHARPGYGGAIRGDYVPRPAPRPLPRAVGAFGVIGFVVTAVDVWNELPQPYDPCAPWFPGDQPHCEVV